MLRLEIPPFDTLTGGAGPYLGFGEPLNSDDTASARFAEVLLQAKTRVEDVFQQPLGSANPSEVVEFIDKLVARMWSEGWSPRQGDVNLFVRDFGVLASDALRRGFGGRLVLRSPTDLSHASIWWHSARLEAFPFHKMLKCLSRAEGDSLAAFFRGIDSALRRVG